MRSAPFRLAKRLYPSSQFTTELSTSFVVRGGGEVHRSARPTQARSQIDGYGGWEAANIATAHATQVVANLLGAAKLKSVPTEMEMAKLQAYELLPLLRPLRLDLQPGEKIAKKDPQLALEVPQRSRAGRDTTEL